MQHSLWKLAAVVGVSGLGFLVILQVQKGLHDPGMIQAAELNPAATTGELPDASEPTAPQSEGRTSRPGVAYVQTHSDDPFAAVDAAAGIDFRDNVPPADAASDGLTPTADVSGELVPVPTDAAATSDDPFAKIRSQEDDTPAAEVVPAGHEAADGANPAASQPQDRMLAQAGDVSDFGPDPFGDLAPLTPDSDAAGLDETPADEQPSPSEQLEQADPFRDSAVNPAAADDAAGSMPDPFGDSPESIATEPADVEFDDPFGPAPAAKNGKSPADDTSPIVPETNDIPADETPIDDSDPFGGDPSSSDPFGADPFGADPFGEAPTGEMPAAGDRPADVPVSDAPSVEQPPEAEEPAGPVESNPFGDAVPLEQPSPSLLEEPAPAMPAFDPPPADEPSPLEPAETEPSADPFGEQPPAVGEPSPSPFGSEPPALDNAAPFGDGATDESPFGDPAPQSDPAMPSDRADSPRLLPTEDKPEAAPGTGTVSPGTPRGPQKAELTVEKRAPQKATLGEPLVYEIHVTNVGESAAHEVIVADVVPKGTTLVGTIPRAVERDGKLLWSLDSLEPDGSKMIKVKVIPVEAGQIGSVATVNFVSEVAAATKVVAPHLTLRVAAPSRVTLGEPVDFRFEVANEGTAPAEKVLLRDLLPAGFEHADGNDLEYEVGMLPPGETETVTLRVAAVKPGQFTNEAVVTAAGGVKTTASAQVAVASSPVTVSRRGPKQRYVGRPATYHNVVKNDSDRPARGVKIIESVPEGMDFVSASHSGQFDPDRRTVAWQIATLPPKAEQTLQVVLTAATEGTQNSTVRVELAETAPVELTSSTNVAGQPELSPSVQGLDEPIAVGERAAFRIQVRNRGNADANGVTVGLRLPAHLKLVDARGGTVQTDDAGRALVRLTAPVPAGGEQAVDFVIESSAPGQTTFRAEVNAPYMSSPLIKDQKLTVAAPRSR